ncbi:MAG TPA: DUF5667 domain-containing protein, partial [Anaerolineales bacterium]|nr:DUF5667 domain-containing protein [Anaerolineales bacterium]
MYRLFVISLTSMIVLLVGATSISAASQSALPGASLYSVKTSLEDAQMSVTAGAEAKAELSMKFADNRLSEIQTLVEEQRYDDISVASSNLEDHLTEAAQQVEAVTVTDPTTGAALDNELSALVARHAKVMGALLLTVPESVQPVVQTAVDSISNDNGNVNDNGADDNGNDNGNDDNGNGNENENENENENDNDDNGNVNENENENENDNGIINDNGNDDNDNGNVNDNGADDNGNDNGADDNGNDNGADDNGNDNGDDNGNDNGIDDNGNENENENE